MSNDLEKLLINKAAAMGTPIKATLELTPLCNLNCSMCYIRKSHTETNMLGGVLPVSFWRSLIPRMKEMGVLFVCLIGGEPFLYSGIQSLYEDLRSNGFYVNITTNGTLLAGGLPDWLQQNPPRYVTVSLYGAGNKTYQRVTGDPEGFTKVMACIRNLLNAEIPVKLNYVMVPENKEDFPGILEIRDTLQLPLLASSYCFPPHAEEVHSDIGGETSVPCLRMSPGEAAEAQLLIRRYNEQDNHSADGSSDAQYKEYIRYLADEKFAENTERHTDRFYCHAGSSTFWITWNGYMQPCGLVRSVSADLLQNRNTKCRTLTETWEQQTEIALGNSWEQVKTLTASAGTCRSCAVCPRREICSVCPAMMEAETGKTDGRPDYLCAMTGEMIRQAKRNIGL